MIFVCAHFHCSISTKCDRAKSITQKNKLQECRLEIDRNERQVEDASVEESIREEEADIISLKDRYMSRKNTKKGNDIDNDERNFDENLYYVAGSPPPPKSGDAPKGPEVYDSDTGAPLPENKKKNYTMEPQSPPLPDDLAPPKPEGGNILSSIVLLLDELDRLQLEVLIRYLKSKMKLVCVPVP